MCGIAGLYSNKLNQSEREYIALSASHELKHRGPDDFGLTSYEQLTLVHQRLSIIELSELGHQPMRSQSQNLCLVFNGEIYNFSEIRHDLEKQGVTFRGRSDTEVLLAALEVWGIESTLPRLVGMFAFCLWDNKSKQLTLARDRMGEKPLYYGQVGGDFMFASELKALHKHPKFEKNLNKSSLHLYFRRNCIPAPHTIYENIYKLPPAHYVTMTTAQLQSNSLTSPKPYWRLTEHIHPDPTLSESSALAQTEAVIRKAIQGQMISDVPIGCFLSGGVDSSLVSSLMQAESSTPIQTFSVGFEESGFDEAPFARAIAQHLGTKHTEFYVNFKDAQDVIPLLPQIYDEPFADSSQIPTYLIARCARQHVKVCLSGDGGDEIFGGYNRYVLAEQVWKKLALLPQPLRVGAKAITKSLAPTTWAKLAEGLTFLARKKTWPQLQDKIQKSIHALDAKTVEDLYLALTSHWPQTDTLVRSPQGISAPHFLAIDNITAAEKMMLQDALTYLPDDILVKVDRASMAMGLESRVPLLDHRVVEWAWSLPINYKIRDGQGKWILRQILYKYVPQQMLDRPKSGFSIPLDRWLRGPLKSWCDDILHTSESELGELIDLPLVQRMWQQHLSGKYNWQYQLWDVLMLQSWLLHNR